MKKTLVILLALVISLTLAAPLASGFEVRGDNPIALSRSDFVYSLDNPELSGIFITNLPEDGSLSYRERALHRGEAISAASLGGLNFSGTDERYQEFTFIPINLDGTIDNAVTVSLTLQDIDNQPPEAREVSVKTLRDVEIIGFFDGSDPEGDALTYRLTSKPRRGEVEVLPDGRFIYTPFPRKTGRDTFTYVAVDTYGNVSKEAKIRVVIEKPSTRTTYADMAGHPAQYAALRLCGAGIFTGRQIAGNHYFGPHEPVSRAEMIVMSVRALGLETAPVTTTGFNDDDALPSWFKPYAQAAFKAGLISGMRTPDGRIVLNADEPATLRQAALLINNALRGDGLPVTEDTLNPNWSEKPVAVILNAERMTEKLAAPPDEKEEENEEAEETFEEPILTRATFATLLVRAMDEIEVTRERSGLLSWVFGWS